MWADVAAAAVATAAATSLVLRDLAPPKPPKPAQTARAIPQEARPAAPAPPRPAVAAERAPALRTQTELTHADPDPGVSILATLGGVEPDHGPGVLRRLLAAIALLVLTFAVAAGVGALIYVGLSQFG